MSDKTPPKRIAELEDRIEQLEATIAKMLPGRRDAMKLGGAAVIGAAAMSGTASAADDTGQVGTIGDASNNVDIYVESVAFSDENKLRTIEVDGTDADGRINFKTS
jgi:hypothetical protein